MWIIIIGNNDFDDKANNIIINNTKILNTKLVFKINVIQIIDSKNMHS